ncbi:MAG: hypothetical protein MI922_27170 [Bacteroidales bacterium]|nr:hypothetical protein [Bacteroidales bacterium]
MRKIKLYELLFSIDCDLADLHRSKTCPYCGAPLHASNYWRKPRGGPDDLPQELLLRHSFCCSNETCRKRSLPVSCRFWHRKVYWGVVLLMIVTLRQERTEGYSFGKLKRLFNVSTHTIKRWISYFKQVFPLSRVWQRIKGRIGIQLSTGQLPGTLVLFFIKQSPSIDIGLIRSIKLLSGGLEMG